MTGPAFRFAAAQDAATLADVARATFVETFGHLYAPEDLAAFLEQHTEAAWRAQIEDPAYHIWLIQAEDGALAGYMKLGPPSLPFTPPAGAIELRQFYLLKPWHGTRLADGSALADTMMATVVARAQDGGFTALYLSVFTDNHRARRFYARHAFEEVGPYIFKVGNHEDADIVMRRAIDSAA